MPFIKFANISVLHIASAILDSDKLVFNKSAQTSNSIYQSQDNKINVRSMLDMVAEQYDISANPKDYLFEAVRAVTADVANQNGDAFMKAELLRFDHRLGKSIYQTFIGKPHHINHRADNPKTSRGVVLDASYNNTEPPLESCPSCGHRTAEIYGRDESGLNCLRCGTTVKDEFVELLLAVDTKKDPTFAEGVRSGSLDSLSMGCEAGYTDCSICDNRARSVAQFCNHIKSGNKKKMFKTASGEKMSFEKCGDVVFTEISRVDQPADPTAKQREIFEISGLPLQIESEMLMMSAKIAKLESMVSRTAQMTPSDDNVGPRVPFKSVAESIKWAESSVMTLKAEIHRLTAEKDRKHKEASEAGRPFYAWEHAAFGSQIKANLQYVSRLEDYITKARDMQASGTPWEKGLTRQMSRFFANKDAQITEQVEDDQDSLEQLKVMHPDLTNLIDRMTNGPDSVPGKMSIDDYTKKHEESFEQNMTPGEMGLKLDEGGNLPTTMASKIVENKIASDLDALVDSVKESNVSVESKTSFANSYKDLEATVTKSGNVKIHTKHGTLFVVRPETKPADKTAAETLATAILTDIAQSGIVATVAKHQVVLGPKMAQVLEYHIEDFDGGREEGDKKPHPEGGINDMGHKRETPEKSLVTEEHTDRKDEIREHRDQSNSDVLEKHQPDHAEALPGGLTPATEEEHSDMEKGHGKPEKTTLKEIMVDFKDKKPKHAQLTSPQAPPMAPPGGAPPMTGAPTPTPDASPVGAGPATACMDGEACVDETCAEHSQSGAPDTKSYFKNKSPHMASTEAMVKEASKKHVSRIERLYSARLAKVRSDSDKKLAELEVSAQKAASVKILRALKLVAKRQALNLEFSPLKDSMFDVLTKESDLDFDTYYPGMDESTAAHLIEATTHTALPSFVDSLVRRASDFVAMNEETLTALENDVTNLRPAPIQVTASQTKNASREDVREAALKGNFQIAPTGSTEAIVSSGGNRDNIRSALGTTKVRRTSKGLLKR